MCVVIIHIIRETKWDFAAFLRNTFMENVFIPRTRRKKKFQNDLVVWQIVADGLINKILFGDKMFFFLYDHCH